MQVATYVLVSTGLSAVSDIGVCDVQPRLIQGKISGNM